MSDQKALPIVHSGHNWIGPKKVTLTGLFDPDDTYLERWILFRTPWFGLQLHKISREDQERDLHNHPRAFIALVLKGGYEELWEERSLLESDESLIYNTHRFGVGRINFMPLRRFHSITKLLNGPSWTLVLVGPHKQNWGFFTKDGFIECDDYPAYVDQQGTR